MGQRPAAQVMSEVASLLRTQPSRKDRKLGTIAYQAERIVRTETNGIYSLASQLRQQQVTSTQEGYEKSWVAGHDSRVRTAHASAGHRYGPDGDPGPIPFDEPYIVDGEKLRMPHDPNASARNRINCRCVSVLHRDDWFEPIPDDEPLAPGPDEIETQGPAGQPKNLWTTDERQHLKQWIDTLGYGKGIQKFLELNPSRTKLGAEYQWNNRAKWSTAQPKPEPAPVQPAVVRSGAEVRKEMLQWHDDNVSKIQKLKDEWDAHRSKYTQLVAQRYGEGVPLSKIGELDEQIKGVLQEVQIANDAWSKLTNTHREMLQEKFIYQQTPLSHRHVMTLLPTNAPDSWQVGAVQFRKIVGDALFAESAVKLKADWTALGVPENLIKDAMKPFQASFNTLPKGSRAYNLGGHVHVPPETSVATVVHELGHSLEAWLPSVVDNRVQFYEVRTKGEAFIPMSKATGNKAYKAEEVTKKDRFIEPYMGKVYLNPDGTPYRHVSEMVSMGVQMLHESPVKLAREDPEFFDWIYDLLRGKKFVAPRIYKGAKVSITGGSKKGQTGTIETVDNKDGIHSVRLDNTGELWTVDDKNLVSA